jgi:alkanesulfonate monooxygenase SsuD/methylene tetrahydromethanopterin reductase-like flavin-dependent oxidoreductase (luciferase family)
LITLDDISGGRLIVGIGAGGRGFDAEVFGGAQWSSAERHERFKEFTATLDQLLREPASSIAGTYYPIVESRQIPGPLQQPRPPLLVSALGPKGIAFAAQIGDGWISVGGLPEWSGTTEEAVREQSARLDEALATKGRATHFERLFLDGQNDESPTTSYERFIDWAERYRALRFNELVIHYPVAESIFDYDLKLFERIATEGRETLEVWS